MASVVVDVLEIEIVVDLPEGWGDADYAAVEAEVEEFIEKLEDLFVPGYGAYGSGGTATTKRVHARLKGGV